MLIIHSLSAVLLHVTAEAPVHLKTHTVVVHKQEYS